MRQHLAFLDGIRGLAATYVVAFHCWEALVSASSPPNWLRATLGWACAGRQAVTVFIVLSGFCLTLPLTREGRLRGGLPGFAWRRAKRILPAWWATLACAAVIVTVFPQWSGYPMLHENADWMSDLAIHAALLQSFDPPRIYHYVGPGWSLSTEWLIYGVFALILVPTRRWLGTTIAVGLSVMASVCLWLALPEYSISVLWFVGCFSFGMGAADIYSRGKRLAVLKTITVLLIMSSIGLFIMGRAMLWGSGWLLPAIDGVLGLATAGLILVCCQGESLVRRFLESRLCRWLGQSSYSLYLVHEPIIAATDSAAVLAGWGLLARTVALGVAAVCSVAVSRIWWRLFERPFLKQ